MRINIWAGPGAGKSNLVPLIYRELNLDGFSVELVVEYIKRWAYENKKPQSYDQLYIFSKQLNAEDVFLRSGVDHIVTDSPVPMQIYYSRKNKDPFWEHLRDIALAFEKKNPSLNIFLDRTGIPYRQNGRYENEEQAIQVDKEMYEFMQEITGQNNKFRTIDTADIITFIKENI